MSLSDYSSMEEAIRNAPEPKILAKGQEVKARIINIRTGRSEKNDALWHNVVFDVPSEPMIREFQVFMWDPMDHNKIDPKQVARNMDQFNKFTKCFGIDLSKPFSWEDDLPGKMGWIIGGQPTTDDYGEKGSVGKFVIGQQGDAASSGSDIPF